MIDNYLLEELTVFADNGTLAKTAAQLMVTQPTVTRGMQKLEEELDVQLFDRQPNKITLTKTGQLAAQKARQLLNANQQFIDDIQRFDQAQRVITIGSIAPGPLVVTRSLTTNLSIKTHQSLIVPAKVSTMLASHQLSLCFTNQEIQTSTIESRYIGEERLFVNLDKFMFLAGKKSVSFKELAGISFIVLDDIGPWKQVIQDLIPHAKFLYQTERDALAELTEYSNFPYFSTNISFLEHDRLNKPLSDRVAIPINDPTAQMPFYASYLKANRHQLAPLLKKFTKQWPN